MTAPEGRPQTSNGEVFWARCCTTRVRRQTLEPARHAQELRGDATLDHLIRGHRATGRGPSLERQAGRSRTRSVAERVTPGGARPGSPCDWWTTAPTATACSPSWTRPRGPGAVAHKLDVGTARSEAHQRATLHDETQALVREAGARGWCVTRFWPSRWRKPPDGSHAMTVRLSCNTRYRLPPRSRLGRNPNYRCTRCRHVFSPDEERKRPRSRRHGGADDDGDDAGLHHRAGPPLRRRPTTMRRRPAAAPDRRRRRPSRVPRASPLSDHRRRAGYGCLDLLPPIRPRRALFGASLIGDEMSETR